MNTISSIQRFVVSDVLEFSGFQHFIELEYGVDNIIDGI